MILNQSPVGVITYNRCILNIVFSQVTVSQLFRTNNEYHNYNTRNCAHIHVPVGTTEASYRTFGYRGIHIWNHISQKININTSYPCFKNLVKIYIQNNNLDNIRLYY